MTVFRFMHAADIHLDSPLRGLAGHEGRAAGRIRSAARRAFELLVGYAIEEGVSFLIIAGDLYDGDWRDFKTGLFFAGQMGRLKEAGIPVYLLRGNHDAASQITRQLDLPDNVYLFDTRKPQTFAVDGLAVALHGQSFRQRDVTDNLALAYPAPASDAFNIGVLHTALAGRSGHESYAPCSPEDLINKGYDYWALGHVHQAEIVHEHPHIVFPGNLQGRHIRETGAKGAFAVTVEDGKVARLEHVAFDVVRWVALPIEVTAATTRGTVIDAIRDALGEAVHRLADDRMLVCRILLQGRSAMHNELVASGELILAEARAAGLGLGDEVAWVEKVVIATEPVVDVQTLASREDAFGELQRLLQEAHLDAELCQQLRNDIGELASRLPHDIRTEVEDGALAAAVDGDCAALIGSVLPYLASRLSVQEG